LPAEGDIVDVVVGVDFPQAVMDDKGGDEKRDAVFGA